MHGRHRALPLVALLAFTASASAGSKSAQAPRQLAPIDEPLPTVRGIAMAEQTFLRGFGSWSGPAPSYASQSVRCPVRLDRRRRCGKLLFKGDFSNWPLGNVPDLSSIAPWSWISDPAPTSPNPPAIIVDPLGSGEHVFAATVDPQDVPSSPSNSSRVDMVGPADARLARPGLKTWSLIEIAFPSSPANGAAYIPTNGQFNWSIQWHANAVGKQGVQPWGMSVSTGQHSLSNCHGNTSSNINPHLFYWADGGTIVNGVKPPYVIWCSRKRLKYNHWYKILTYTKWATNSTGRTKTWIDGALAQSISRPTLFKDGSTGAIDVPYLELGNYRWMGQTGGVTFSSTILYKKARVGTTKASVLPAN
jgi:Polysaccharide lyase